MGDGAKVGLVAAALIVALAGCGRGEATEGSQASRADQAPARPPVPAPPPVVAGAGQERIVSAAEFARRVGGLCADSEADVDRFAADLVEELEIEGAAAGSLRRLRAVLPRLRQRIQVIAQLVPPPVSEDLAETLVGSLQGELALVERVERTLATDPSTAILFSELARLRPPRSLVAAREGLRGCGGLPPVMD